MVVTCSTRTSLEDETLCMFKLIKNGCSKDRLCSCEIETSRIRRTSKRRVRRVERKADPSAYKTSACMH